MNACDGDPLAAKAPSRFGIIIGRYDALVFVGSAHKQAREFDVGPPLQRRRRFGIEGDVHWDKIQLAIGAGQYFPGGIDAHCLRQLQLCIQVRTPGRRNLCFQFNGRDRCARECAPIGQPGFETIFLGDRVFLQLLLLLFADGLQRAIVKCCVKRETRGV